MTRRIDELRAGVVGTGFIGVVHVDALRRLGVEVAASSARPRSAPRRSGSRRSTRATTRCSPTTRVDVVHITTPNHLHYAQVKAALAAGKHVVCEKPLALTAAETAELLRLAERSGLVHCTNFNIRFYPQVQAARDRVARGELGDVWNVHGGYLQDWLLRRTDWNWRLDPEQGGELRAVADIGSHWLDLVQFVTGLRGREVFADLATVLPVRRRPTGPVETFAGGRRRRARRRADVDARISAHILVRFRRRRTRLVRRSRRWRRAARTRSASRSTAREGALAWDGEQPEELWLGHRDEPNASCCATPA